MPTDRTSERESGAKSRSRPAELNASRRVLASPLWWSPVLALLITVVVIPSAPVAGARQPAPAPPDVRELYLADCGVCHGAEGRGTSRGPTLVGVGRASLDYEISSGRMPLAGVGRADDRPGAPLQPLPNKAASHPDMVPRRHAPAYPPETIRRLVDYTWTLTGGGGPDIPHIWYMGWLEGALRLAPAWRIDLFGYTISEVFWPGVVLPGITFGLLYLWPFIERRFTRDTAEHHILDRPRERPIRTAIGVGGFTFFTVLFVAGSSDIGAQKFVVGIPTFTRVLQVLVVVLPIVTALIAWKICRDLNGADKLEAEKERIRQSRHPRVAEESQPA